MITRILDRLFVGDSEWTAEQLRALGIWKVVNVGGVEKKWHHISHIHLSDDGENNPSAIATAVQEVSEGVRMGPTLVCCRAGISRSPFVVVQWLQRMGMSRCEAYEFVKAKAPATQINIDLLESM